MAEHHRLPCALVKYGPFSVLPGALDGMWTLASFAAVQKETGPLRFPDLSLSIIKLIGPGSIYESLA